MNWEVAMVYLHNGAFVCFDDAAFPGFCMVHKGLLDICFPFSSKSSSLENTHMQCQLGTMEVIAGKIIGCKE